MAVSGLNDFYASGMGMPARGVAAFSSATRFDLLLLSAAALPVSWQCSLIPVYRQSPQCGERSNAAFGTQSAAKQTSLAPHDSKARLQDVTICRRFMAKPCTPHLHCAARAVIQAQSCQCAGSRGKAPCVLLGDLKGAILSRERMAPFAAPLRVRREKRSAAALHHAQRNASTASPSAQRYSRPPLA